MSKASFKDREHVVEYLGTALSEKRLAIFLGAGVSRELINTGTGAIGLPGWAELISRLYRNQKWSPPVGENYIRYAEDFKNKFLTSGKTMAEFIAAVSNALYFGLDKSKLDFSAIRKNATLSAIGALVSHSRRGHVTEVFTLNFDDILERYLRYYGLIARPIIDKRFWVEAGDVVIHHPHGFLPSPGSPFPHPSDFLVFDEHSYVDQDPNSRWNQRMEVAMQAHVCLLVGLGRDDFHLKTLVNLTSKKHAYSPNKEGYWGVVLRASPTTKAEREVYEAEVRDWATYDIFVQPLADYQDDLPSFLFSICQYAALHS